MMDYAAQYGLEFNPFLKNAKDVLLDTSDFTEGNRDRIMGQVYTYDRVVETMAANPTGQFFSI